VVWGPLLRLANQWAVSAAPCSSDAVGRQQAQLISNHQISNQQEASMEVWWMQPERSS